MGHDHAVLELQSFGFNFAPNDDSYEPNPTVCWSVFFKCPSTNKAVTNCTPARLAEKGFAEILKEVGAGAKRYDDIGWATSMEKALNLQGGAVTPILPLACARSFPNLSTIKVLVDDIGLDVNAQLRSHEYHSGTRTYKDITKDGSIHVLAQGEHWWNVEALQFILQRGADTEIRNGNGQTALHVALDESSFKRRYKDEIVSTLLDNGVDPNATDAKGATALVYAANSPHLVKMLVKYGATVNSGGEPPLIAAVLNHSPDTVALLVELGADVNMASRNPPPEFSRRFKGLLQLYPLHAAATKLIHCGHWGADLKLEDQRPAMYVTSKLICCLNLWSIH